MPDHPMMNPPRDLSPQEAEDRAKTMYDLSELIAQDIRDGREALWSLAKHLTVFSEEAGWAALGYDTVGEWLADPDISMTRSTYNRLRQVYSEMRLRQVPEKKMITVDISKAQIVLPAIKAHHVKLDDALEDARVLGARDLRIKYLGSQEEWVGRPVIDGDGDLIERDPGDDDEDGEEAPEGWEGTPGPLREPTSGSGANLPKTHSDNSGHLSDESEAMIRVPRWVAEEIVEKFGTGKRMSPRLLDPLRSALEFLDV